MQDKENIFCENRRAYHDYQILKTLEAGIILTGPEVKAVCRHEISLAGAYVYVSGKDELFVTGINIAAASAPFADGRTSNLNPRGRKLLCHRKEIAEIKHKIEAAGLTVVPLKMYENRGRIKILIGIARGKNVVDKRHEIKKRDIRRELSRIH